MERSSLDVSRDELELVRRLREGDEDAFMGVVEGLQPHMLRVAQMYVSSRSVAEEVVQDAWIAVLRGIDRFEGRSSLRTWIFRIVANQAKTRGQRESRSVPFSSLTREESEERAVDPSWFHGPGDPYPGHWVSFPHSWSNVPEDRTLGGEMVEVIRAAIEELPAQQAAVIGMRDVLGLPPDEVCNALELNETNQRVLLHRARSRVRRAVDTYLREETKGP